jgi:2-hydroxy-4-carboxymuconate semialdehyde hemiacetal dehydrogenase
MRVRWNLLPYICDNGTYIARYDELIDGSNNPIDVLKSGCFDGRHRTCRTASSFRAIQEKREPNSSVAQVLPAMRTLDRLEKSLK